MKRCVQTYVFNLLQLRHLTSKQSGLIPIYSAINFHIFCRAVDSGNEVRNIFSGKSQ